jgi:hypothetical protein
LFRPSTLITDSNLADLGRARRVSLFTDAARTLRGGLGEPLGEGHQEGLRRTGDEVAGTQSGSYSIERTTVNTGTIWSRFLPEVGDRPTWVG